jgi:ribosomal protein S18 acetylase RimI-like enzyme
VIEFSKGLSAVALDGIVDLERRVVAADGGRLKLEWNSLRRRSGHEVEDVLWWDGDRLTGFLGVYSHGAPTLELAGMVDPGARHQGIGSALLDAGLGLCQARQHDSILLIVPRASVAGRALALRRDGRLQHSEHALQLLGEPSEIAPDPGIRVRPASAPDQPAIREVLHRAFGWAPLESADLDPDTFVIERDGWPVGTARMHREGDSAGVYGFAVHPDHQGRGIGRDVLYRLCRAARAGGATAIHLEVATDNDRALRLYTSLGFRPVTTEDYYALPER